MNSFYRHLIEFVFDQAPLDPSSLAGAARISSFKQTLKNCRIDLSASLISHALVGFTLMSAGVSGMAIAIFVTSVGFDAFIKTFSNKILTSLRSFEKTDASLAYAREAERSLIVLLMMRCFLALAAPVAVLAFGVDPTTNVAAAALMIAASLAIFMAQTSPRPRVLILGTWPIWAGLVVFGVLFSFRNNGAALGLMAAAYFCCMMWFARYQSHGQSRLHDLLAGKDSHTQQLAAALERHKRDSHMFDLLENDLPIGFFDFDARAQTFFWSPGTFRAYGREPGTAVPTLKEQLGQVDPEGREQAKSNIAMFNLKPGVHKFVMPILGLDGVQRQVSSIIHSVMNEAGELVECFGMVDDQTELRTLLTKSEQLENRLETALLSGCSMVWDLEKPGNRIIGFGAVAHFLRPDQDPHGDLLTYFLENMVDEDRPLVDQATKRAYLEKRPQTVDFRFSLDGKNIRHGRSIVTVFGSPVSGTGSIRSFVTDTTEDVERREALDQARANAELANRAKSAFLANMSHEIRTPLNGIVAITGALAQSELTQSQREMVELVCESGASLERVLNDILDLARVESGKLEIEAVPFLLSDLISGTAALFELKADDKGLKFVKSTEGIDDIWLLGDGIRIRQILANLLSNAIKFTAHGQIGLTVSLNKDDSRKSDALRLSLEVSDTGPGIAKKDLARLFNRFEQVDASITREHGGSGLGLSICKSLAQLMGGQVSARSKLGSGSTFNLDLYLPIVDRPSVPKSVAQSTIADSAAPESSAQLRILAADDHPTNRRVLQMILEPLGVDLILCEDGQQAIDALEQSDFDLVLMDLQMPVMDGLTAISTIRSREATGGKIRMPIIAVSANAMAHHKAETLEAGADMHIAKPFTPALLVQGIEAVLDAYQRPEDGQDGVPTALAL